MEQEHKRRVRYSGTHPKQFSEKYKELNPEKYAGEIEKILNKGATPAGMHRSIMVNEILEVLAIKPGEIGLDATLGYGGHTQKMLEKLNGVGHLYATDIDPIESEKTKQRLAAKGYWPEILTIKNINFCNIDQIEEGLKFDFVLADLGVSSMQIDSPQRGFTFKHDGPLDLRFNPNIGVPASERLLELSEKELIDILVTNSDEPFAEKIARQIVMKTWHGTPIETTKQLYEAVTLALDDLPKRDKDFMIKKSCQRVFQALRIDINQEFEVLETFLDKLSKMMKPKGRIAILTFHSGEDRLVKKSFKSLHSEGVYEAISDGVIRPSSEEIYQNPRSKSTKLRWAIKS